MIDIDIVMGCFESKASAAYHDRQKAGQPGWACIVPVYNIYVMCIIAGKEGWWTVLFFIPIVNIIIGIMVSLGIAEAFGKGAGYAIGLFFLPFIFYPMLGFGDAQYG